MWIPDTRHYITSCWVSCMHIYLVPVSVNRWKPKYCAKIKAKKNTYQLNLEESSHNYTLAKTFLTVHLVFLKHRKSIKVTLHRSWQLLIWNQINAEILGLPNFWLRNVCCFTMIVVRSCRNITNCSDFVTTQSMVMHITFHLHKILNQFHFFSE
jgi:hypothetical protein